MLETEEATKNALIMPFLAALGYDVFDPTEVIPEYNADVGTKKGEKVDYAVKRGEDIVMIIEAKKACEPLAACHSSQLFRYFSVTKARIGILTNGVTYRFFSDLEKPNIMDSKPFLELDMLDPKDTALEELTKLTKESFDIERILSTATDLKYMREIRQILESQFEAPDEDLVRFFFNRAQPGGRFTQSAKTKFSQLVRDSLAQTVSDRVSDRLRAALAQQDAVATAPVESRPDGLSESPSESDAAPTTATQAQIVTTDDELEGFRIIRAILRRDIPPFRVYHRDTKSYFGVILDDNNRKPICRLHLNRSKWYIGLFDENKREHRHPLGSLDDIYEHADALIATAKRYADSAAGESSEQSGGGSNTSLETT